MEGNILSILLIAFTAAAVGYLILMRSLAWAETLSADEGTSDSSKPSLPYEARVALHARAFHMLGAVLLAIGLLVFLLVLFTTF